MIPSVPSRLSEALRPFLVPVAAAALLAVPAFLTGCEQGGTAGPAEPDPPDLSTPRGAIDAFEVHYGYREADDAIALLAAGYTFSPLEPDSIPFLDPGETSWPREDEQAILEEILTETRATWLDQVLLEITILDIGDVANGEVAVEARTDLHFGENGGTGFVRSRSTIEYVFQIQANGDHLLLRETELARDTVTGMRTVGEQKARAYARITP